MDNKEKFKLKLYNTVLDRTEVDDLLLCLQTCLKEKDCVFEYKIYRWDQWSKMIEILFDQFPIEFIRLLSVSASLAGKLYKDFYFIASNSDFAVTNNPKKRYFVPDNDKSFPNIEEAIQSLPSDDASDYPVQIMHCLDLGNLHNAFELEASEIWSPYSDCKDFTHLVYGSYNKKERFQKLIKVRQSLIRELSKELLTSIAEENLDKRVYSQMRPANPHC